MSTILTVFWYGAELTVCGMNTLHQLDDWDDEDIAIPTQPTPPNMYKHGVGRVTRVAGEGGNFIRYAKSECMGRGICNEEAFGPISGADLHDNYEYPCAVIREWRALNRGFGATLDLMEPCRHV